jgi:hypothetical protein
MNASRRASSDTSLTSRLPIYLGCGLIAEALAVGHSGDGFGYVDSELVSGDCACC